MSIHEIPDKYLNTTLTISRGVATHDDVGDASVAMSNIYTNVPANVQPKASDIEYKLHGRVERQTHRGYINRTVGGTALTIHLGDIALDNESGLKYTIIGNDTPWQSPDTNVTDSHHFQLALKATTGTLV